MDLLLRDLKKIHNQRRIIGWRMENEKCVPPFVSVDFSAIEFSSPQIEEYLWGIYPHGRIEMLEESYNGLFRGFIYFLEGTLQKAKMVNGIKVIPWEEHYLFSEKGYVLLQKIYAIPPMEEGIVYVTENPIYKPANRVDCFLHFDMYGDGGWFDEQQIFEDQYPYRQQVMWLMPQLPTGWNVFSGRWDIPSVHLDQKIIIGIDQVYVQVKVSGDRDSRYALIYPDRSSDYFQGGLVLAEEYAFPRLKNALRQKEVFDIAQMLYQMPKNSVPLNLKWYGRCPA